MAGGIDGNTHSGGYVELRDQDKGENITRVGLEGSQQANEQAAAFHNFLVLTNQYALNTFSGRDGGPTYWSTGDQEGSRNDYLLGNITTHCNTRKLWVDHRLGSRWQYTRKCRDHFPLRLRMQVTLPRTVCKPKLGIQWARQRMQIALDDVEMRTPFLTEVLEWKRANAVELAGMSWKTTPAEVERHWTMFNDGITPIAQKHFALSKKKERQPWASPELAALTEAKKQALQVYDAHRVRWSWMKALCF